MKERIEAKLVEQVEKILKKKDLTPEETNFIVFMLNRIETKEITENTKRELEESNKMLKERLANMFEVIGR